MALSQDVRIERYGVPGNAHQPLNRPLGAGVTVYRGSIALTDANGNIKNASNPSSTDLAWGIIEGAGPGTANLSPGIVNSSTVASTVTVEIGTGCFYLASGTGSDQLNQSNVGQAVYVINETTVGLTSGGSSRPKAGVLMNIDFTRTQAPGFYAIDMGTGITGPAGGP
jgi:hypothetical protein